MQSNDCKKYRELLFDYASDMLDDAESKELEMHINSCSECSGKMTEIKAMLAAAAQIEDEKPSGELKKRISESLAEEARRIRQRRRIIFGRTAAAAISVAACAALAVGIYSGGIYDKFVKNDDGILNDSVKTSGDADINASGDKNNAPSDTDANTDVVKEEKQQEKPTGTSININTSKNQPDNKSLPISNNSEEASASKSGGYTEAKESNTSFATESENSTENTKRDAEADEIKDSSGETGANYTAPQSDGEQTEKRAIGSADASGAGGAAPNRSRSADYTSDIYAMDGVNNASSASASSAKAASEPVSCTVICDNPTEFAKQFGVSEGGDTISFDISLDMWQSIVGCAADCGAELVAEYGENSKGIISVTVMSD